MKTWVAALIAAAIAIGLSMADLQESPHADQLAQAQDQQAQRSQSAQEPTPEQEWQIGRARGLFVENCSLCHDVDASGDIGPALAGNGRLADPGLVVAQILFGGGGMPAFGSQLTDEQVAGIAGVVRTSFGNQFGPVSIQQVAQQREQFVQGGAWYSLAQAARGYGEYRKHCIACHGTNLEGRNPNPALSGEEFANEWGGRSVSELFDFVSAEMPAGDPGNLVDTVYADLVALILNRNGVPAGSKDLDPTADYLGQLVIPR
jgi:mono/diheme cytochrome c family protein